MKSKISLMVMAFFVFAQMQAQVNNENTITNEQNSSAIGLKTVASGVASFASGITSTASGLCSTTIGIDNLATGDYSVAIGSNLAAAQGNSIVIGSGDPVVERLTNKQTYSLMVGFLSQYPTLFVSTSPRYNKTGSIAIGNVVNEYGYIAPQSKLHLRADEGEEAAMFIESDSWESNDTSLLYLGNKAHGISADVQEGMMYNTEKNHVFKGGDIFVEDIDKGIIMKSPDGKCWRGTLDNSGSLQFIKLDACPGTTTSVFENKNNSLFDINVYPNPADNIITVKIANNEISKNIKLNVVIINQNGTEMMSKYMDGSSIGFFTGDLASGSYFVKVTDGHNATTKQFIKK